jgi:hypothetical protein
LWPCCGTCCRSLLVVERSCRELTLWCVQYGGRPAQYTRAADASAPPVESRQLLFNSPSSPPWLTVVVGLALLRYSLRNTSQSHTTSSQDVCRAWLQPAQLTSIWLTTTSGSQHSALILHSRGVWPITQDSARPSCCRSGIDVIACSSDYDCDATVTGCTAAAAARTCTRVSGQSRRAGARELIAHS